MDGDHNFTILKHKAEAYISQTEALRFNAKTWHIHAKL